MYNVQFNGIQITEFQKESDAIQFSVGLHLTSSVPHTIEVEGINLVEKDNGLLCTLIRK